MNSRGETSSNNNNKKGDEEGGRHQFQHHENHKQSVIFTPNIVKITVVFSLLATLICLFLYSAYPNQYTFNFSYNALASSSSNDSSDHESLSSPTNYLQGGYSSLGGNSSSQSLDSSTQANSSVASLEPSVDIEESEESKEGDNLKTMLHEAAMADNTVILTTLNAAWAQPNAVFDLFLESFKVGNQTQHFLNHMIVAALDETAYSRCKMLHSYCYYLTTKDVDFSREAFFMTDTYLKMMWRRIDFLRIVLEMGYNFIFTDVDILWFRNPFLHFYPDIDFQIACDHYKSNASDLNNDLNGGFNFVKSNKRTIQFYRYFYKSKDNYPGKHDQDVLNLIKFEPFISEIGIQIRFLDTAYYGGFCEPSKDLNEVCTMHANCCVGLHSKVVRLSRYLNDWRRYMALLSDERKSKPMNLIIHK